MGADVSSDAQLLSLKGSRDPTQARVRSCQGPVVLRCGGLSFVNLAVLMLAVFTPVWPCFFSKYPSGVGCVGFPEGIAGSHAGSGVLLSAAVAPVQCGWIWRCRGQRPQLCRQEAP